MNKKLMFYALATIFILVIVLLKFYNIDKNRINFDERTIPDID